MGLLSGLTGGLVGGVADAVDRFVETPDEKAAAELKRRALDLQPLLAQIKTNQLEAQHASIFVAGARPATLWVLALCMAGLIVAGVAGWWTGRDVSALWQLYAPFAPVHLGLLGLRSYEKSQGIHRDAVGKPRA